jgi:hypothetical protein
MGRATSLEKLAASLYYRCAVISPIADPEDNQHNPRKTGLTVGDWGEEEEEVGEEERDGEAQADNYSFVLEMLLPARTGSRWRS